MIAGVANGLLGEYYDDPAASFTTPPDSAVLGTKMGERVDATINFTWLGSPSRPSTHPCPPRPTTRSASGGPAACSHRSSGTYTFSFLKPAGRRCAFLDRRRRRRTVRRHRQRAACQCLAHHHYDAKPLARSPSSAKSSTTSASMPTTNTSTFRAVFQWQHPSQATPVTVPSANLLHADAHRRPSGPTSPARKLGSTAWTPRISRPLAGGRLRHGRRRGAARTVRRRCCRGRTSTRSR